MVLRFGAISERHSRYDRKAIKDVGSILVMDVAAHHPGSIVCKLGTIPFEPTLEIEHFSFGSSLYCCSIGWNMHQPHMVTTSIRIGRTLLDGLLDCYRC